MFDNEFPIYHTTVDDVALRKSPCWQAMFSIRNIKQITNDQDVVASKGKESLNAEYPPIMTVISRQQPVNMGFLFLS